MKLELNSKEIKKNSFNIKWITMNMRLELLAF